MILKRLEQPKELLRYPPSYCAIGLIACLHPDIRYEFWTGFIVLSVLISVYAWMSHGPKNKNRYAVADNCYFIGFIYTLALIAVSIGLDHDDFFGSGGATKLLQAVAIALGTSVVGMLWRLGLTHGLEIPREELDKLIDGARHSASRFQSSVDLANDAVHKMSEGVSKMGESASQMNEDMSATASSLKKVEEVGDALTNLRHSIDGVSSDMSGLFRGAQEFAGVMTSLSGGFSQVKEHLVPLAEGSKGAGDALANLHRSIDKVSGDMSGLLKGTEEFADFVASLGGEVNQVKKHLTPLVDSSKEAGDSLANLHRSIENVSGDMSGLFRGTKEFTETMTSLSEDLKKVKAHLTSLAGDSEATSQKIIKTIDSLVDELHSKTIKAFEKYQKSADETLGRALEETQGFYARLIRGSEIVLKNLDNPETLSKDLQDIKQRLDKIVSKLGDLSGSRK